MRSRLRPGLSPTARDPARRYPPATRTRLPSRSFLERSVQDLERLIERCPRDVQRRQQPDYRVVAAAQLEDQAALESGPLDDVRCVAVGLHGERVDELDPEHEPETTHVCDELVPARELLERVQRV